MALANPSTISIRCPTNAITTQRTAVPIKARSMFDISVAGFVGMVARVPADARFSCGRVKVGGHGSLVNSGLLVEHFLILIMLFLPSPIPDHFGHLRVGRRGPSRAAGLLSLQHCSTCLAGVRDRR